MDIEDYKRAEEQLRRSAEELQRSESYLAEGQRLAHMGSWAFDAAGFDYWSPELFRMHGLEPASKAPTVQEYLDCVHPQDREFMAELIKRILAEPSCFDTTKRIVRPDGEVRYIRCVGAPVVENQALKKFVGSAIDVTEQELLTLELHRREAYLTEAQRLSHTGSFGWRPASGEIVWSDETYRIFSRTARKPSLLPGSGLLPLAAHEPVMAGSLTAILDTCAVIMAGMNDGPTRQAQLTFAMARHAVADLAQIFARSRQPVLAPDRLPPSSLSALRDMLANAGITVQDGAADRSFTICGRCMKHTSSA